MFIDPGLKLPFLKVAYRLLKKKLGFRYLMDVIPLDSSLIKGSHGRITDDPSQGPILIGPKQDLLKDKRYKMTDVYDLILLMTEVK
jgi:hypothetical protein